MPAAAPDSPTRSVQRSDTQTAERTHRLRWWTLAVLSLTLLVIVIDSSIVNVAIPTLADKLHAGSSALEWIVDAYTLVFTALLLPAGALGDRYGRHHMLAVGMLIFGGASLGAALSTSSGELIVFRALMGVGAALAAPATMALISTAFADPVERAKAVGIWSSVTGLGIALGPTAGGWLLDHFAWGSIFMVNLPIVAVALVAGRFVMPESKAEVRPRFDPPGIVLGVLAASGLTYSAIEASSSGWNSTSTYVRAAVSVILLAGFIVWERRTDHPMIDLGLFRDSRFSAASGAIMVLFFGLAGMTFVVTQIYQFILGYTPLQAGVRSLPAALAVSIGAPVGSRLAARFGSRGVITAGLLLATAGLGYFASSHGASGYPHYLLATIPTALGIGLTSAVATNSVMSALPPAQVGVGSAISNATRNLGTVLGIAVLGSITATTYTSHVAQQSQVPEAARQSIGAAAAIAPHVPSGYLHAFHSAVSDAFVHGAVVSLAVASAAALLTAIATFRFLRQR